MPSWRSVSHGCAAPPSSSRDRRAIFWRCLVGTVSMSSTFYALSSRSLSLGDTVTLLNLTPVFLALLAPIFLGERTSGAVFLALALSLGGVVAGPASELQFPRRRGRPGTELRGHGGVRRARIGPRLDRDDAPAPGRALRDVGRHRDALLALRGRFAGAPLARRSPHAHRAGCLFHGRGRRVRRASGRSR